MTADRHYVTSSDGVTVAIHREFNDTGDLFRVLEFHRSSDGKITLWQGLSSSDLDKDGWFLVRGNSLTQYDFD